MRLPGLCPAPAFLLVATFTGAGAAGAEEITTASGLKYEIVKQGAEGPHPKMGDRVKVHYTGTLTDGTKFDSSHDRGQPAQFELGRVIAGWNEGLQLMTPGSQFKFTIPGNLAYGEAGMGDLIPPNATLLFDVELLEVYPFPVFERVAESVETKTSDGCRYEILKPGTGKNLEDDMLVFDLTIWDKNGQVLDSTVKKGAPNRARPTQMRHPFLKELLLAIGVGGAFRCEVASSLTFGPRLPPNVQADDPCVWLIEVSEKLDVAAPPEFAMPKDEELKTTESGLKYQVVKEGEGKSPNAFSRVQCHYTGWLIDGTRFDSSFDRGQPTSFALTEVVKGWTEGLQLMKTGAIYKFVIPPALGYGDLGRPPVIPPNATLVFQIELIAVQ